MGAGSGDSIALPWAILITLGAASVAAAVMLLVRRRAPEGSYFADGDRAAGIFGVIATGFSVLLGLIVFLAFESYDQARTGARQRLGSWRSSSRPRSSCPSPSGWTSDTSSCVTHDSS